MRKLMVIPLITAIAIIPIASAVSIGFTENGEIVFILMNATAGTTPSTALNVTNVTIYKNTTYILWAEKGTINSNEALSLGNGQTPWGQPMPHAGWVTRVSGICTGTVGTTLGIKLRKNNVVTGCTATIGNTINTVYTQNCNVSFVTNDVIGLYTGTETGAYTECVFTAEVKKEEAIVIDNVTMVAYGKAITNHSKLTNLAWSVAGHTLNADMLPTADNTYDFGSAVNRWQDIYGINLRGSSAFISAGVVSGTGSTASASYSFTGDTDTGMFSTANNKVNFTADNANRFSIAPFKTRVKNQLKIRTTSTQAMTSIYFDQNCPSCSFMLFDGKSGMAGSANIFSDTGLSARGLILINIKDATVPGISNSTYTLRFYDIPPVDASVSREAGGTADIHIDEMNIIIHKHVIGDELYDYAIKIPIVYDNLDAEAKTRLQIDQRFTTFIEYYTVHIKPDEWDRAIDKKQLILGYANERIAYRELFLKELVVETIPFKDLGVAP